MNLLNKFSPKFTHLGHKGRQRKVFSLSDLHFEVGTPTCRYILFHFPNHFLVAF